MKIRVLCVGKMKEKFFRDALAEYAKRLSRYCKLEILEVPEEKTPDHASKAKEKQSMEAEGRRLLRLIRESDYVIALAIEGEMPDSEALAQKIDQLGIRGVSTLSFVIGGSLGLSEEVLRRADETLSFSRLTFPHQMIRVFLLEQIYRSFRLIHGEPYHK